MLKIQLDIPNGLYQVKDGNLYKVSLPPEKLPKGAKVFTIPDSVQLQHVGYSDEELGREK